jgi:hypothetical protein
MAEPLKFVIRRWYSQVGVPRLWAYQLLVSQRLSMMIALPSIFFTS